MFENLPKDASGPQSRQAADIRHTVYHAPQRGIQRIYMQLCN
jgi:hypothetical protein